MYRPAISMASSSMDTGALTRKVATWLEISPPHYSAVEGDHTISYIGISWRFLFHDVGVQNSLWRCVVIVSRTSTMTGSIYSQSLDKERAKHANKTGKK